MNLILDAENGSAKEIAVFEAVDALTQRMREDGYRVLDGPRTTGDGCYESCVVGVEDNLVELTV